MESEAFPTRSEAIDFGKDYEFLMAAYYGLNFAFRDEITDFKISSNNKEMGDFDDVVIELELRNSERHVVAFQLKHVNRQIALIMFTNAKAKNKNFSLDKYTKEFVDVKKHFQNSAEFKNFHFILYTNSFLEKAEEIDEQGTRLEIRDNNNRTESEFTIFKSRNNFGEHFFDLSQSQDCIYKFRTDKDNSIEGEFFQQFSLYTNQKTAPDMETFISRELLNRFRNRGPDIVVNYLNYFKHWCRRDFGAFKITKDDLLIKFADYLLAPLIPNPDIKNLEDCNAKTEILLKLIMDHDLTVIETEFAAEVINKTWSILLSEFEGVTKEWTELLESVSMSKMSKHFNIPMSAQAESFNQMSLERIYLILWHMNLTPLLVKYNKSTSGDVIQALKICSSEKRRRKIILIGQNIGDEIFKFTSDWRVFKDLSDFFLQNDLIRCFTLSIQGRPPVSLEEILKCDSELSKLFSPNELIRMLDDSFIIGKKDTEELPFHYITRSLTRTFIDIELIYELENDLFVLNTNKRTFKDIAKYFRTNAIKSEKYLLLQKCRNTGLFTLKQAPIDYLKRFQDDNKSDFNDHFFIYTENLCSDEEFSYICSLNPNKNCHHVRFVDGGSLEWINTNGSIENLRNCRQDSSNFSSEYLIKDYSCLEHFRNKITIIIGDPGMGKTIFFRCLKEIYSSTHLVIKINFNKHVNYLKEIHEPEELLEYFLKNECETLFDFNYFHHLITKKKLLLLWDGFDDLPKSCFLTAISAINSLKTRGFHQWISARSNVQLLLESEFGTFASELTLLTSQEQFNFIFNSLGASINLKDSLREITDKIIENMTTSLDCGYVNYVGIPLHLNMIVEIFKRNPEKYKRISETISLADIYERFLDGKFQEIFKKAEADAYNYYMEDIYERYKDALVFKHEVAALESSFDKDVFRSLNLKVEDLDFELGIISGFDDGGCAIFVHKTYQEFLVASWLAKNRDAYKMMVDLIFEKEYNNIRLMFDMILAKNSAVHLAVIYRKMKALQEMKAEIASSKDEGGRNPLQIACSWGFQHPLVKTGNQNHSRKSKHHEAHIDIIKLLVESFCDPLEEDRLLNWNSLNYCCKTSCFEALELICSHCKFGKNPIKYDPSMPDLVYYSIKYVYNNIFDIIPDDAFKECKFPNELLEVAVKSDNLKILSRVLQFPLYKNAINENCSGQNPLSSSLEQENFKLFEVLLENCSTVNGFKIPPLTVASRKGFKLICEKLLEKGADINETDNNGNSSLLLATKQNHLEVIELLLKNGSDVDYYNKDVSALTLASFEALQIILRFKPDLKKKSPGSGCSVLHAAATRGDLDTFTCLISAGAEITATSNNQQTPLHVACVNTNLNIVKDLLARDQSLIDFCDTNDETPLFKAVMQNNCEIVRALVEAGADVNKPKNKNGESLLHIATDEDFTECLRILLDFNANVNGVDWKQRTPLFNARSCVALDLLMKHGSDINARDKRGATPLHLAAFNHQFDIVQELISRGVDIDVKDNEKKNVLNYCIRGSSVEVFNYLLETKLCEIENELIIDAFNMNSFKCLEVLLKYGADINYKDKYGESVLFKAALQGSDYLNFLLENGADPNIKNNEQYTPLEYAIGFGHTDQVRELIKYNADLKMATVSGSALHLSASNGDLLTTILLIDSGAEINAVDQLGQTPLHRTASCMNLNLGVMSLLYSQSSDFNLIASNNYEECAKELIARGAEINKQDNDLNSVLHMACVRRLFGSVRILIEEGIDLNLQNLKGQTGLHVAYQVSDSDLVDLLIQNGARIDVLDNYGKLPLYYGFDSMKMDYYCGKLESDYCIGELEFYRDNGIDIDSKNIGGETFLHCACSNGDLQVADFLLKNKADVEAMDREWRTPIFYACQSNNPEILKLMSDHRAKIDGRDCEGNTVLHLAASMNRLEMAELLISDFCFDVSIKNSRGDTALHFACNKGRLEVGEFLISKGLDCNERNNEGLAPFHLAITSRNQQLISFLLCSGAIIDAKAMCLAVNTENIKIIQLLIDNGGKLDTNDDEESDLSTAIAEIEYPTDKFMKYLYQHGTKALRQEIFLAVCAKNQYKCAELFLKDGYDVNYVRKTGGTALMVSSFHGNLEIVRLLINHGANVNYKNSEGFTAIFFAIFSGNSDLVEFLISKNAELNLESRHGFTPLFCVPPSSGKRILEVLNKTGLSMFHRNKKDDTLLHEICKSGNVEGALYLIERGLDVNAVNCENNRPLHFAVVENQSEVVRMLLGKGAEIGVRNNLGFTPMETATHNQNTDVLQVFFDKFDPEKICDHWSPCFIAASCGNLNVTQFLLNKNLVKIDYKNLNQETALHRASFSGRTEIVSYLIEKGADVNALTNKKETPLMYLSRRQETPDLEIARLLLDNNVVVNAQSELGHSALFLAAANGHLDLVKILHRKGAEIDVVDFEGDTPLHGASAGGHLDVVKYLMENGADVNVRNREGKTPKQLEKAQ